MPSVAWFYPEDRVARGRALPPTPFNRTKQSAAIATRSKVTIHPGVPSTPMTMAERSTSNSRPKSVPGEMPPLFVIGSDGETEIVNYRALRQRADRRSAVCSRRAEVGRGETAEGPDHPQRREAVVTDSDQVNGHPGTDQPPAPEVIAQALRLRPERPRVTRLSRKMLASATALALVLVSGAVLWALQNNQKRGPAPEELYTTDHHNVADGLGGLPKDYAGIPRDVPRLGPPLPGDLGRPIVSAQNQSGSLAADAELQRVNQESEAARTSKVFAATNVRPSAATTASNEIPANAASSSDEAFVQNGQDRKLVFVNASVDRRTTSPDRLAKPGLPS